MTGEWLDVGALLPTGVAYRGWGRVGIGGGVGGGLMPCWHLRPSLGKNIQSQLIQSGDDDYFRSETRRKSATGTRCPTLFDKGSFLCPVTQTRLDIPRYLQAGLYQGMGVFSWGVSSPVDKRIWLTFLIIVMIIICICCIRYHNHLWRGGSCICVCLCVYLFVLRVCHHTYIHQEKTEETLSFLMYKLFSHSIWSRTII